VKKFSLESIFLQTELQEDFFVKTMLLESLLSYFQTQKPNTTKGKFVNNIYLNTEV
jgi:hypothetical protein